MKIIASMIAALSVAVAVPVLAHENTNAEPAEKGASRQSVSHEKNDRKPVQHSGGTDANGCHKNHTTGDYHCHNPK